MGKSERLMGKSLHAMREQNIVFTQEVLFNNEKGRVDNLRELLRTALLFFVLHLSACHEVREPSGGNKARRICPRH